METAAGFGTGSRTADGIVNKDIFHEPTPTTKLAQVVVLPPTLKVMRFSARSSW